MPLALSRRTMPQIPSDVWAVILHWLTLSHSALSLKSASLISRTVGYEADRFLWGNLKVESLGALVTLSRMILARARISPHLSTICVQTSAPDCMPLGSVEIIQTQKALMQCKKLSVLELYLGPGDLGVQLVRDLHIPPLRVFSTDLAVDVHLLVFLERHPTIQELHIGTEVITGTNILIHECMLPNLQVLEAPLPLATMLLPYRPISHLKVWASCGLTQELAIADALHLIGCMRLSATNIVSFRFEDGPPYTPTIHHYGAEFSQHMKLLGLLFIDREEEDQAIELAKLTPGLQVIQFDNAMANRRTSLEQRDFVLRLGQAFESLWLVSSPALSEAYLRLITGLVQAALALAVACNQPPPSLFVVQFTIDMSSNTSRRERHPYSRPPPPSNPDGQWVHDMAPGSTEERKPRPISSSTGEEPARLVVSNLHYEVTQKDLSSIFGTIGTLLREPTIRYDRSGRSTGVATVVFAHTKEAKLAQKQLDGVMAKGEAMVVKLDSPSPGSRPQSAGRNSTNTLLSRMEKKPLAARMTEGDASTKNTNDRAGSGPARNARGKGKQVGGKGPRAKPAPKTAEDLDKELEAFMGDGDAKVEKDKEEDVSMA